MAKQKAKKLYQIHNATRMVSTRLTRVRQARRERKNILLGGGLLRVPRGRPRVVTEAMLMLLLPELLQKHAAGAIIVTTLSGVEVDLKTLKPMAPEVKPAPRAKKPLDSVDNDESFEHGVGQPLPNLVGGKGLGEDVKRPEVLGQAIPDGIVETTFIEDPLLPEASAEESEGATETVTEAETDPVTAPVEEDLEAVLEVVYTAYSKKQLQEKAAELGVEDVSGNKSELAERLVAAGLRAPIGE